MGRVSGKVVIVTAGSDRMCEPEDIANVVLFLASDESRYVTALKFWSTTPQR